MDIKKERLECLAWLKTLGLNNVEFDENLYITSITRQSHCDLTTREIELMLRTWLAAKQQAIPEGFVVVPVEPTHEMWSALSRHLGRYMQTHDRYCPKTLKKYFDRFIGEPPEWLSKEVGNWDSEHAFATADLPVFIYKAMIQESQK